MPSHWATTRCLVQYHTVLQYLSFIIPVCNNNIINSLHCTYCTTSPGFLGVLCGTYHNPLIKRVYLLPQSHSILYAWSSVRSSWETWLLFLTFCFVVTACCDSATWIFARIIIGRRFYGFIPFLLMCKYHSVQRITHLSYRHHRSSTSWWCAACVV